MRDRMYQQKNGNICTTVKTTELYNRRGDEVSFSEIERVGI
jgi:hypothetical protein